MTITQLHPSSEALVSSAHLPPSSASLDTVLLPAPPRVLFPPLFPADFLLQICVLNLLLGNLTCKCSGHGRPEKAAGQLAVRAETQGHWVMASVWHRQGCCCCCD